MKNSIRLTLFYRLKTSSNGKIVPKKASKVPKIGNIRFNSINDIQRRYQNDKWIDNYNRIGPEIQR